MGERAILPAFVMCVGMGDSVHVLSVFRGLERNGRSRNERIGDAKGDPSASKRDSA